MKIIKYKNGMTYKGPAKHTPKFQYAQTFSKRKIFEYLESHQAQYPQYWFKAVIDTPKCTHQLTILERMQLGPHKAKRVCADCGAYIKWEKIA